MPLLNHADLYWHMDWCCTAPLLIAGLWYALGLVRLWRHAGIGRGATLVEVGSYTAGWLAIAASILSPLHALGTRMFTAHMVEHEVLMVVAAPLLVLSKPLPVFIWAFSPQTRKSFASVTHAGGMRRFWTWFTDPVTATILHAAALWGWHIPGPFQAALVSEPLHALQHVCFLGTALVFWWSVLSREARRKPGMALVALFVTAIHTMILGVLFTVSRGVWYPNSADPLQICGLNRLEDQQLAGIVMWVPAGMAYIAAALWLIAHTLKDRGRHEPSIA